MMVSVSMKVYQVLLLSTFVSQYTNSYSIVSILC